MDIDQVEANVRNPEVGPVVQTTRVRPRWRGTAMWLLACLGGGFAVIAALLAWGQHEFGSLGNTLAYLNGHRLLAAPDRLSFGTARRGEEKVLHVTIQNRTGKNLKLLGARSTCGCMATEEQFPIAIADGGQRELTVRVWLTGKDSKFEGRIDYYTDDETNSAITVVVRGTIVD